MYFVISIFSLYVNRNNLKDENKKINEFILNKDLMFLFLYGFGNEVKLQSNGLSFVRFYFLLMIMDVILLFI